MLHWVRSLIFVGQMYLMIPFVALAFAPWAIVSRQGAVAGVRFYARYVRWTAALLVGLRSEVRGDVPQGEVIVASKHQSFFDIIILTSVLPRPRFIMKKSLKNAPFLGWYAARLGCVAVDRGKRGQAIQAMVDGVLAGMGDEGQLIIFPEGTRVAPRVSKPYKVGVGVLVERTKMPCVPAATNVGLFWPRIGIARKSGLAVVEFLPPIPAGQDVQQVMAHLEREIEAASDALMDETGL